MSRGPRLPERLRRRLPRSRRGRVVLAVALVLVVVAGLAAWRVLGRDDDSRFAAAARLAPASTVRLLWTDWTAVRAELDPGLKASASGDAVEGLIDKAFDADLGSNSILIDSAAAAQDEIGISPATVDWELSAQDKRSAITLFGIPDDFDTAGLRERLREIGFTEPDRAGGIWKGGGDVLTDLEGEVTGELAYLQIDDDAHLIAASNREIDLREREDDVRGDRDDGLGRVVDAAGDTISAAAFTGDYTCTELAMTQADPADRTRGNELIAAAGGVRALAGYSIAGVRGGGLRFSFALDDDRQAREDADSRSKLASGPAPGQGGDFPDLFTIDRTVAADRTVTIEATPVDGALVLSDLDHGPVLFAAC